MRVMLSTTMFILLALQSAIGESDEPQASEQERFRVTGYLMSTRSLEQMLLIPLACVTDVIWFSIEPNADGTLNNVLLIADKLDRFVNQASKHNIRVHLAVGGWERCEHFAVVARDDEKRATFVKELTKLCRQHDLAGADIDWEYPRDESERAAATLLLRDIRASFDELGLELSVAVASRQAHFEAAAFDFVHHLHIMSYDHHGSQHGPHSTFDQAQGDTTFWRDQQKITVNKLLLGVPFYGRRLGNEGSIDYRTWSDQTEVRDDINEAGGYFINNHELIAKKVRYAREQGLGGVMIWELGHDRVDGRALLRTIGSAVAMDESTK